MQGSDGKAAGKDAPAAGKDKDDHDKVARVRLNPDLAALGKGASKEAEAWHDKSAVKRLEAVRLRGALLDAGSPPLPQRPPPCLLSFARLADRHGPSCLVSCLAFSPWCPRGRWPLQLLAIWSSALDSSSGQLSVPPHLPPHLPPIQDRFWLIARARGGNGWRTARRRRQ